MFTDKLPGKGRGSAKHYACMSLSEIMRMPLPPLHDNCVLFLWRVSSMVEEAYQVVRAWDFVPKTELVWEKTTDESGEKLAMGMGRILRGSHETCIVAARGRPHQSVSSHAERTIFRAPRTEHSAKPEEFYRIVERPFPLELWPEAHVELFARRRRRGWVQYGLELPGTWEHTLAAVARDEAKAKAEVDGEAPRGATRRRTTNGARPRP
jgi:N6-adenosine-specific RNA methylase IME4